MEPQPDIRRQKGPHVFVDDLDAPALADDDWLHLTKSLRLRVGDPITISDAAGSWRPAYFGDEIELNGPIVTPEPPRWPITLSIALAKGSKPELATQKATELGVDAVVLFVAERSVPVWNERKMARSLARLEAVARSAAMQSRRVDIPTVTFAESMASLEAAAPDGATPAFADMGGVAVASQHRHLVVGPEGGWTADERAGFGEAVDLGPTVLRAETAAIVAVARMVALRGGG